MAGFNFRSSAGSITDGAGETYVDTSSTYPTTRAGYTFGWVSSSGSLAGRTRNTSLDRRLVGQNQTNNSSGSLLFATDSGMGTFDVTLALGDASFGSSIFAEIVEINNSQVVQSILSTVVSGASNSSSEWYDASGANRTSATDWVNNNLSVQVTVSTGNSLGIRIGDPAASSSGQSKISHFSYASSGGGGIAIPVIMAHLRNQGIS